MGVLFGLALGVYHMRNLDTAEDSEQAYEEHIAQGKLTNPLLYCDQPEDSVSSAILPFKPVISDYINKNTSNQVDHISYYFRDMNSGYWITINEDTAFSPASLLKVPLYMSIAKLAEKDPSIWQRELIYKAGEVTANDQNYRPTVPPLLENEQYTVRQLTDRMIMQSDNDALQAVYYNMGTPDSELDNTVAGLFHLVRMRELTSLDDTITVGQYARFFRLLYNASFLSQSSSEEVLEKLSQADFKEGIRAGVPEGITVAQKFGERKTPDYRQLHDCGIVYHPKHPYMICIMTRGQDFDALEKVIADLSRTTWQQVSR